MTGRRRRLSVVIALVLAAAGAVVASPSPAGAGTVTVNCHGDDSVLQGRFGSGPMSSQSLLDWMGINLTPPINPPVTIDSGVALRIDPVSVVHGSTPVDFYHSIVFSQVMVDTAVGYGIDELLLSNVEFEVAPGDGVEGPNLVGAVPDRTIVPADPVDLEVGPFTADYDVTAPVGGTATWDLVRSEVGLSFNFIGFDIQVGVSCEQTSAEPAVTAPVIDGDPEAPIAPARTAHTVESTPVDIDLVADDAVADPASATVGAPTNGAVSVSGGVATYTPDPEFVGADTFAYEVCSAAFTVIPAVDEVDRVSLGNTYTRLPYTLTVDGATTVPLQHDDDLPTIVAAVEDLSTVGDGNVIAWIGYHAYDLEFVGDLAATSVEVSAVGGSPTQPVTVTETRSAGPAQTATNCASNVVDVMVTADPDDPDDPSDPDDPTDPTDPDDDTATDGNAPLPVTPVAVAQPIEGALTG